VRAPPARGQHVGTQRFGDEAQERRRADGAHEHDESENERSLAGSGAEEPEPRQVTLSAAEELAEAIPHTRPRP